MRISFTFFYSVQKSQCWSVFLKVQKTHHRTKTPRTRYQLCLKTEDSFCLSFFQEMEIEQASLRRWRWRRLLVTFLQPHEKIFWGILAWKPEVFRDVFWVGFKLFFSKGFSSCIKKISHKSIVREPAKKPEAIQEWNMVQANLRCLVETIAASEFSGSFIVGY